MNTATHKIDQERLLKDHVERLRGRCDNRRAVHVHLSDLRPKNRQPQHLRIAASTFEELVIGHDGHIFNLSNGDLVFIWRDASIFELDNAVLKLRYMFGEDPLTGVDPVEGLDRFATWYELVDHYDELVATVDKLLADSIERRNRPDHDPRTAPRTMPQTRKHDMKPEHLATLEQAIRQADLSNLMRRQAVCAVAGNQPPQPVFHELFISIGELANALLPNVDLAANRWLFQHLTQFLDRRMLALLDRNDDRSIANAFSINLNVSTLTSREFDELSRRLGQATRSTVVVELQFADIVGDMDAYVFAKDFLRERGFRICLDGVTSNSLPLVNQKVLDLDLVKLIWHADMVDGDRDTTAELRRHISEIGKTRSILCRCDDHRAIRFGQSIGIALFQGRFIDSELSDARLAS